MDIMLMPETKKIREAILGDAQSEAERFANNWLATNPKQ